MDEIWERAVETALDGQTDVGSVRTLTLDGVVKCVHGRLPPPSLFEKFQNLQHLSIANIGVSSLEQFPRLQNLEKLILSDNRIAGGLEFLVAAGLNSLRDLDLSNNRIQDINDLRPLAELRLVSLDLYECPVTRVKDYRSRVFGLIKSLKYLDKMDAEENERPESDEEEDEEDDEDDPGSGEIDGEERPYGMNNGHRADNDGIVDVDEDEESDADEEETEISRGTNGMGRGGLHHQSNGFRIEGVDGEDDEDEDGDGEGEDDEENDSVEEIDEEGDEDEDVVEVHEIEDSDDEEDGVEDDEDEDDDDEEDEDEEEVDNDDGDFGGQESTGRLTSTEGEIDGHEQGEDDGDDDDDNGETGEEEQGVEEEGDYQVDEEAEDEEEDYGSGYLVQPVAQAEGVDAGLGEMQPGHDYEDADLAEDIEEEDDEDGEVQELPPSSSHKRKRDGGEDDSDDGGNGDEDEEDDDIVECTKSTKSSKHQK